MSDSFAGMWPGLAAEFGLCVEADTDVEAWLGGVGPIRIVAAGGVERTAVTRLDSLKPRLSGSTVVLGSEPDHRLAMALLRAGASEYFALPTDLEQFRSWLREQVDQIEHAEHRRQFAAREEAKYQFDGLIGTSPALRAAIAMAARVIPRPAVTVLITGETGTGKELLARAIHYNGPRKTAPFVDINCAAIPEQLLESELFGHEKGAFTNATAAKPGLLEVASGGTLFLDEIGHLSLPLQGKMLRALEQRTIRRVGGNVTINVDVRIIAATHVYLPDQVHRGEFREDLYYRLNVLPIDLPPLRNRGTDVVLLARHFLHRFAADYGLPCPILTREAEARILEHPWPGNVRELRNVIERSLLLLQNREMGPDDVAFRTRAADQRPAELLVPGTLRDLNRAAARLTVERCRGNKSEAARRLGISRTRLLRLLGATTPDDTFDEDDS